MPGAFRDTQTPPFRPRTTAQSSRRFCPSPPGAARCRAHGSGRRLTQTCRQPKSKIRSACTKDAHNRHLPFSRHWRNARIPPTFSSLVYHFFCRLCCSISSNLARTSPYDVRGEGRNVLRPPHGTPQIFPHRNLIRATTAKRGIPQWRFSRRGAERQRAQRGKLRRRRGTRVPAATTSCAWARPPRAGRP